MSWELSGLAEILNQLEPSEGECFNESVLIISLKQNLFKRLCVNKTQSWASDSKRYPHYSYYSYRPTNGFIFDIISQHFLVQQIFVDWHEMVNGHRRADNMKHLSL